MQQVVDARSATGPTPFAKNVLEIAVPPDNPGKIAALADLAKPGVKVALCQPQVPCGDLAQKVLATAKVQVAPVTLEADVKATLTKVQLGEVDAGLVYVTDVKAAGDKVLGVRIPYGRQPGHRLPHRRPERRPRTPSSRRRSCSTCCPLRRGPSSPRRASRRREARHP